MYAHSRNGRRSSNDPVGRRIVSAPSLFGKVRSDASKSRRHRKGANDSDNSDDTSVRGPVEYCTGEPGGEQGGGETPPSREAEDDRRERGGGGRDIVAVRQEDTAEQPQTPQGGTKRRGGCLVRGYPSGPVANRMRCRASGKVSATGIHKGRVAEHRRRIERGELGRYGSSRRRERGRDHSRREYDLRRARRVWSNKIQRIGSLCCGRETPRLPGGAVSMQRFTRPTRPAPSTPERARPRQLPTTPTHPWMPPCAKPWYTRRTSNRIVGCETQENPPPPAPNSPSQRPPRPSPKGPSALRRAEALATR